MGIFLGRIDIKGTYYNFTPLYRFLDDRLKELTEDDCEELLPDSEKRNINFSYAPYRSGEEEFMESTFYPDVPIVFEFDTEDLEINYDKQGNINPTGYKIPALEEYDNGKIYSASDIGYSLVINEDDLDSDPRKTNIIEIGTNYLSNDTTVFIKLKHEDVLIGPYEISFRSVDQTYIISTKPEENQYVLKGFSYNACDVVHLVLDEQDIIYAKPNSQATKKYVDIINDKTLLESFKNSIKKDLLIDGKLDLSNTDLAIDAFNNSALMVEDGLIRKNRLQRIQSFLQVSDDVDGFYKQISEYLGSELGTLISNYDNKDSSSSFINTVLESNPELLNKIPDYSYTKRKIEGLKEEESRLQEELDDYQNELEKAKNFSEIDQEAIKSRDELQSELDSKKEALIEAQGKLEEIEAKHDQFTNYDQLKSDIQDYRDEIDYLEKRKVQLDREIGELSVHLSDVTTNIEKRLSEIPIDGLVANQLVEASSKWKIEQEKQHYRSILDGYNNINISEMSPDDMVEYMYNCVKEVRPLYDKNTVTNICTCIFQNFLTVFSGDPGCGKTSVCNIIGQALGLEKVGEAISQEAIRYIPVSVERGWTSKRDFIGYYNPLTKTFDKNNKRVFEALQIADIEEECGLHKLPLIILLDEANLSPMEYYWADFMNVCDDLSASNEINIGEDNVLNIPETLHFVATINNDHTTETLSPRLIDRAAVITLPKVSLKELSMTSNTGTINKENVEIISWDTVNNTYICPSEDVTSLPTAAGEIYDEVLKGHLRKQLYISPRTELSLIRYCSVSARLFDRDVDSAKRDPSIIALDYAIAQKILPKINGYGEDYKEWLDELRKKCEDHYLIRSKEILSDIIIKGRANMNYYQFFA